MDIGNNPWAEEEEAREFTVSRASWRPNTAAVVITKCGHIELEWELIRNLGGHFVKHVYCETCREWVTYKRATAKEIIKQREANNGQQTMY